VTARITAHLDAGADHVAVQVLSGDTDPIARRGSLPRVGWQRLADALGTRANTTPPAGRQIEP
jgi:hypothetical protein